MGTSNVTFYDVPGDARMNRIVRLVEAAWERGKRLLIHCLDEDEAVALDGWLWSFQEEAFIPHERVAAGEKPEASDASVVLVWGEYDPIGAEVLLQAAPATMAFAEQYGVVIDLVDHRTPGALHASRARYKAWCAAGVRPVHRKH